MYIPDLFGAYTKGRELAIQKNWEDLRNYESVESQRNQNDLAAMDIWERRQTMPGKISMFYDNARSSSRANEVGEAAQDGMVARADMGSMFAQDQRGVYLNNRPTLQQVMNDVFSANLGKQATAAGVQQATNAYWTPERQYNAGQAQGQVGYNTAVANGVASTDFVPAAQRTIAQNSANHAVNMATSQFQLNGVNNAIDLQPDMFKLEATRLDNAQHQQDNLITQQQESTQLAKQNELNQAYREYISYLRAAQAGDQVSAQAAMYLANKYGFPALTQQAQPIVQTPVGQTITANTAPLVNYIGMGTPAQDRATVSLVPATNSTLAPATNRTSWTSSGGALGITGTIPRR